MRIYQFLHAWPRENTFALSLSKGNSQPTHSFEIVSKRSERYTTSCSIMSAKVSRRLMSLASPSLTITIAGRGFKL